MTNVQNTAWDGKFSTRWLSKVFLAVKRRLPPETRRAGEKEGGLWLLSGQARPGAVRVLRRDSED